METVAHNTSGPQGSSLSFWLLVPDGGEWGPLLSSHVKGRQHRNGAIPYFDFLTFLPKLNPSSNFGFEREGSTWSPTPRLLSPAWGFANALVKEPIYFLSWQT